MMSPLFVFLLLGLATTCLSNPQYGEGGGFVDQQQEENQVQNQCGHASYDCVPYFQCIDGVINTDGKDLIDRRTPLQNQCINADYPDVPAICCLIPGAVTTPEPIQTCPVYQKCVDYSLCSAQGTIVTDGTGLIDIRTRHVSCYLDSGIGGICCTPPAPHIDVCPGKSVCTLGTDCFGTALDASNNFIDYDPIGLWTLCSHTAEDGVCCIPPLPPILDVCPGESVCLQPSECLGTALDASNNFIEYVSTGIWTRCSAYDQGVCCINPHILLPASTCGVRNYKLDQRISSPHANNEAEFGEFPWQSIIFYRNYTFNCGASLISQKYVITAAHCIHGLTGGDIRIRFGEWQVNSFDEKLPYVDHDVHAVYIHPKFNPENVHNDIAVIELAGPIDFQYHINSICLPESGQIFKPYTSCFATGWGKDSFQGTFQHILKKIRLPFIDDQTCQSLLRKTRLGKYFLLDKSFVCAGGEENRDACYGDGGGPLVCKDETTSQYILVGITSWGIGCGTKDVPGVYANVEYLLEWVKGVISGHGGNQQQQQSSGYGK